jgi:hypothetical protein
MVELLDINNFFIHGADNLVPSGAWTLQGREPLRIPHSLDNRFTNGGEVFSFTRRPPFILRKIPGADFCSRLNSAQSHNEVGKIRSNWISTNLISN